MAAGKDASDSNLQAGRVSGASRKKQGPSATSLLDILLKLETPFPAGDFPSL